MHQVRTARPQHVAVPPAGPAALELSREEREQMRVVRHHAFQRHHRNAVWLRELLHFDSTQSLVAGQADDVVVGAFDTPQEEKLAAVQSRNEALKQRIEEQEARDAAERQCHAELLASLQAADSNEAVETCRARIADEAARHASANGKELKTIKL